MQRTKGFTITEILVVSRPESATYTFVSSDVATIPQGETATGIVAVIVSVAVSITEIVLLSSFVMYANGAAPAILASINTASAVIPKDFMMHPLYALLDIITGEN